jgi:hypothetical protein
MMRRRVALRRALSAIALGCCAAGLGGCSLLGAGPKERRSSPIVLTSAEITRYPAGGPARDFLRWWRQLQYNNPKGAAGFYASDAGVTPARLEWQLKYAPVYFNFGENPEIEDVSKDGDRATVTARLQVASTLPSGKVVKDEDHREFELVREDGVWKQQSNAYLGLLASLASNAPAKEGALPIPDTGKR